MPGSRGNPGLRGKLVDKGIEAYILALETINRLSIKYRVESFCYLLCNAWELLLKAKLIKDAGGTGVIYYADPTGEARRTLALRDCLKKVITNQNDAVRLNLESIADLRDEACHLVIGKVPKEVLGLFQSSVLNYHRKLNEWFGVSLSDRVSVGMMTIAYDFKPEEFDLHNPRLRREMGGDTARYLLKYQADILDRYNRLGKPVEFSIDIDYCLAIVKKVADGDIMLTAGPSGTVTQVVRVAKDSGETHPYRQKELIEQVNAWITPTTINSHDLLCIRRTHAIDKRSDFFYQSSVKGSPKQYSEAYVSWLVGEIDKHPDFVSNARKTQSSDLAPTNNAVA